MLVRKQPCVYISLYNLTDFRNKFSKVLRSFSFVFVGFGGFLFWFSFLVWFLICFGFGLGFFLVFFGFAWVFSLSFNLNLKVTSLCHKHNSCHKPQWVTSLIKLTDMRCLCGNSPSAALEGQHRPVSSFTLPNSRKP